MNSNVEIVKIPVKTSHELEVIGAGDASTDTPVRIHNCSGVILDFQSMRLQKRFVVRRDFQLDFSE